MTAYARAEYHGELGKLTWELRSVNHRYLDISTRLPDELRGLEPVVREKVAARLSRGKVECGLRYRPAGGADGAINVNMRLADQLIGSCRQLETLIPEGRGPSLWDLVRWPGVLEVEERDMTPVQSQATELLDEALDQFEEGRRREGERLAELVGLRCENLRVLVGEARERMPRVVEDLRARLRKRIEDITVELDPARLEQEIVLLVQRMDVDEEMDRLATHVDEVARVLKRREPVGRRLDFLMQELNREANTLASKSADVEMTRIAVELKVLIEQMREQVQNVE